MSLSHLAEIRIITINTSSTFALRPSLVRIASAWRGCLRIAYGDVTSVVVIENFLEWIAFKKVDTVCLYHLPSILLKYPVNFPRSITTEKVG
jgi:hypothetical protein